MRLPQKWLDGDINPPATAARWAILGIAMRLNGWQRLWMVLATIWALVVLVFGYQRWPMALHEIASPSNRPPDLDDQWNPLAPPANPAPEGFYDALAKLFGGKGVEDLVAEGVLAVPATDDVRSEAVRAFYFSTTTDELIRRLSPLPLPDSVKSRLSSDLWHMRHDPSVALARAIRTKYPNAYSDLSDVELEQRVLAKYSEYKALIEPTVVQRRPLSFSERHALAISRATFAGQVFSFWAISVAFLYVFGWSVGWIRRGFGH